MEGLMCKRESFSLYFFILLVLFADFVGFLWLNESLMFSCKCRWKIARLNNVKGHSFGNSLINLSWIKWCERLFPWNTGTGRCSISVAVLS